MDAAPVLRIGRFSYAFPGGADFVLRQISLDVYPGQCHCLTGPSGCGKTTLLMAIRGLLPPGRQAGTVDIRREVTRNGTAGAGIVFQNPVTQLISPALGAEVAFGMENHCIAPVQMPAKVCRALADAGLDRSVDTPVAALSPWASNIAPAWQLFLAFWPGMVFIASNPTSRVTRSLARVLPPQTALVVSACLRFLPLLLEEMNAIRQAQIFRGTGLLKEDLKRPRFWPDWVHCLLVPTLVRALSLSADIALAAEARDFGIHKQRTHWPGED